jgi:hypothetical protein
MPQTYYMPCDLHYWTALSDETRGSIEGIFGIGLTSSAGFVPLYETRKEAEKRHPTAKIVTVKIPQVRKK